MQEGCQAFLMGWEAEVEKALLERKNNADVEQLVCYEVTGACKGVDSRDAPRFDDEIFIDGQPHKVNECYVHAL